MAQEAQPADATTAAKHVEEHGGHPDEVFYIKVALILFLITAVEVAASYAEFLDGFALIAVLMVLAIVKFVMVALFFMHLRFDNPLFARFFIIGIGLALGVYLILLSTLHVWE